MSNKTYKEITGKIIEMTLKLQASGWVLPYYVAVVASNGFAYFIRFELNKEDGSVRPEFLAEHLVDPGLKLPINVFFVNPDGRAERVVIENWDELGPEPVPGNA